MLVTCICVCHDKSEFAHEAIQSIVEQSYPYWEALIVDSGMLFDRGYYDQFAWRNDARIRLIRSDETPALRRSKAMAPWCFNQCYRKGLVGGELVMYLCDDDVLYPNAFETFVAYAKQHPEAQAMYASQDIGIIRPDGSRMISGERRATAVGGWCVNGRHMDCEVDYLQFCHRRDVLNVLPGDEYWPETKETESHADGIFMERIGEHVPIYPIDIKVSQNRRTPCSVNDPVEPTLPKEMLRWRAEAECWRQQYVLNRSFVHALGQSLPWKVLKPLRALRRLLRPRGFDARALIPWRQIQRDEAGGAWVSTGPRPCFLVPCELAPGRYRLRVSLTTDAVGWFEIIAAAGNGIGDVESVFGAEVNGVIKEDRIIELSRPALGVQINPLGAAGKFEIKQLELHPLGLRSWWTNTRVERVESSIPTESLPSYTSPQRKQGLRSAGLEDSTHATRVRAQRIEYPDLGLADAPSVDWSIIIPTVGGVERVRNCVSSCRRHIEPGLTAEFIVVDDGTPDLKTIRKLEKLSAELGFELRRNHQNLGFSASVNQGMRNARGRFILLCNNDIVFQQRLLGPFSAAFQAVSSAGIVGCKLLYPDGTVQHAGMDKVPGQLRWTHAGHGLASDHPSVCRGRFVWSVTGALCAFRGKMLQSLGGLSTAYGFAYEDLDYCLRAWSRDVRVYYCSDAVAVHAEAQTLGKTRRQRKRRPLFWAERERAGRRYFEKKWRRLQDIESFEELANLKVGAVNGFGSTRRHSLRQH
jgi:GT2 family glycosyltransferase